jgi:hypothetical protein
MRRGSQADRPEFPLHLVQTHPSGHITTASDGLLQQAYPVFHKAILRRELRRRAHAAQAAREIAPVCSFDRK